MKNCFVGQKCEWNALISGKITRLRGVVTDFSKGTVKVVGETKVHGLLYSDIVDIENLILKHPKTTKSET